MRPSPTQTQTDRPADTAPYAVRWLRALALRWERTLLILAGALALSAVLVMSLDFNLLEASLYDLRMRWSAGSRPSPGIALISIDDTSTTLLDEFSPLPIDLHAQLLEALEQSGPRAIGYIINWNDVMELSPAHTAPDWTARVLAASERLAARNIPVLLGSGLDVTGEVLPPFPLSALPHAVAIIHRDGNVFAEDKITRRALARLDQRPSFHLELARRSGDRPAGPVAELPRGSFRVPEADAEYFFFRYQGDPAEGHYAEYSAADVLHGRVPADALRGKILLVGTHSSQNSADYAFTPFSKAPFASPKLQIHAHILDSILQDNGLVRPPTMVGFGVTFVVSWLVIHWVMASTPLYGVFLTLALAGIFTLFSHLLFQFRGVWLRESQPLVGIFVSYYLAVPYRLIREYKKRWDFQRKNELLTQVEELKTNFLSLVTHDLKTPVARIQGLAEVVLRKAAGRLLPDDRSNLEHVVQSTEELNRFISSILELSNIESRNIKIETESKDINRLVERAVESFRATAAARGVELVTELDPLFPIRLDANLVSKILNNLIDNAIKYSPDGGRVTIRSREDAGWVQVSVQDEGIGMTAAEREQLFTRFYRAKNDTTTRIAGTGLGLYLTRYFVEAHRGYVEVESEPGKGSQFRIFLPLDEAPAPGAFDVVDSEEARILVGLTRKIASRLRAGVKNQSKTEK